MGSDTNPHSLHKYTYGHNDPAYFVDPSGNQSLTMTMTGLAGFAAISTVAMGVTNVFNIEASSSSGLPSATEIGLSVLLTLAHNNSALLKMAFGDSGEANELKSVQGDLEALVDQLANRDSAISISVPTPPRKKRWCSCIARAQDLMRRAGRSAVYGWGWGLNRDLKTAKKQAVRMANLSIGAVDTHHTQWACIDSHGNVHRP